MSEANINKLSIDELFAILIPSTKELIVLVRQKNSAKYGVIKKEVLFLQRLAIRASFIISTNFFSCFWYNYKKE